MAHLHCHKCGWEQDDFWTDRFNPLYQLAEKGWLRKHLLSEKWITEFDGNLKATDIQFKDVRAIRHLYQPADDEPMVVNQPRSALVEHEHLEVEPKAYVIAELRKVIRHIENMRWRTMDEWQRDMNEGDARCPRCGSSKDFDID